ncbi:MAG TPA: (S)-benzoin forming benzil reductase [Pseudogracilibacillus sp.]|nr:(S)-benzoin forming benzil reductase [Pseudogracilibacillus sp.]
MNIAIVTGVSRGLGQSVATYLLELSVHVYGIARTEAENLHQIAKENGVTYEYFPADLSDMNAVEQVIQDIQKELNGKPISNLYVINNAAIVQPIQKSIDIATADLQQHFQLNVVAPMVMMNKFLRYAAEKETSCIGVNVTSGAAHTPFYGWSAYCSAKASIEMYTKTVALEQAKMGTTNKVIAFSPGVMDTNMQEEIRSTTYEQFIDVDTFKDYKQRNILTNTDAVASVLVDIITDEVNVQNGKTYNVNDYF